MGRPTDCADDRCFARDPALSRAGGSPSRTAGTLPSASDATDPRNRSSKRQRTGARTSAGPGYEPGAEIDAICERLDRLPLALELAATRVKLRSEQQLLTRLEQRLLLLAGGRRDLPRRHSTMRATIAWSYDLLTRPEQRLFTRLGVVLVQVGGCRSRVTGRAQAQHATPPGPRSCPAGG